MIFEILAWIFITIVCFIIAPFFTIAIIFIGAKMPILAVIFSIFGVIHMILKMVKIISN